MRLLHTMIRVANLDKSIDFYTNILGMKVLRTSENTDYKYTHAFVGFAEESDQAVIELTHNWDQDSYQMGTAFGHIALGVEDIYGLCNNIIQKGADVYRKPGPVKGGDTVIAFVRDPDGYVIELIQH